MPSKRKSAAPENIQKAPTGIDGLDSITDGGLPRDRTTLVAGGAGSGKTLLGMEFLLRGALRYGEPGVAMLFEETADEVYTNFASLGYDLPALVRAKKLIIDHVQVQRHEIEETGEYDLEGLFVRIDHAIRSLNARRVLLDTIEVLFSGLQNTGILRSELRRLFRWIKTRGVTAMVTAEAGDVGRVTRQGLEEYVADCVIFLDHRVTEQISTRRIRIVKYRGSRHGTNEYPFLINEHGVSVLPITSLGLTHVASTDRVPTGIEGLDEMLGKKGFYRGSSVLLSGTAGTGKSSLAAYFVNSSCERGERALYFAFEESQSQILRNMRAVSLDLEKWIRNGRLQILSSRPTSAGLESHLAMMHNVISQFKPSVVVVDPITNLISVGTPTAVKGMLTRLIDFLKMQQITALFTNLSTESAEQTTTEISSLMDTWLMVRDVQSGPGARKRIIYVLKSRGMSHSNEAREFLITDTGIRILGSVGAAPKEGHQ